MNIISSSSSKPLHNQFNHKKMPFQYNIICTSILHNTLDNVKIGNLKRKNRDHKKVPKQDEDIGNLQLLLHLRSLF